MGINAVTDIAGPLAVITNHGKVLLVDEVILHVFKHGGGARA